MKAITVGLGFEKQVKLAACKVESVVSLWHASCLDMQITF